MYSKDKYEPPQYGSSTVRSREMFDEPAYVSAYAPVRSGLYRADETAPTEDTPPPAPRNTMADWLKSNWNYIVGSLAVLLIFIILYYMYKKGMLFEKATDSPSLLCPGRQF